MPRRPADRCRCGSGPCLAWGRARPGRGAGGFADGVADRGPADTEEAGQHVHRAQAPLVEDGRQDALTVADLLVEDAAAGSGLAEAAAPVIAEALGLGGLQRCELPGEVVQAGAAEPGQRRAGRAVR